MGLQACADAVHGGQPVCVVGKSVQKFRVVQDVDRKSRLSFGFFRGKSFVETSGSRFNRFSTANAAEDPI